MLEEKEQLNVVDSTEQVILRDEQKVPAVEVEFWSERERGDLQIFIEHPSLMGT